MTNQTDTATEPSETGISADDSAAALADAASEDRFAHARELAEQSGGFVIDLPRHLIVHIPPAGGPAGKRLVVSFDNLASARAPAPHLPWGYGVVAKQGWGSLGVMAKVGDFLRSEPLYDALEKLSANGFFRQYAEVSMYGTSMGGYGAATFAPLVPGCTIVAFAPQSTLDRSRAPFEGRYPYAQRNLDWTGRYSDAIEGIGAAGKAYMLYDPSIPEDRAHVARLMQAKPDAIPLACPFMSHKLPPAFLRMGLLKDVAVAGLSGTLEPAQFRRMIRVRRENNAHRVRVLSAAIQKGHLKLAAAGAERALATLPNWKIRKLKAEIEQLRAANPAPQDGAQA